MNYELIFQSVINTLCFFPQVCARSHIIVITLCCNFKNEILLLFIIVNMLAVFSTIKIKRVLKSNYHVKKVLISQPSIPLTTFFPSSYFLLRTASPSPMSLGQNPREPSSFHSFSYTLISNL